MPVGGDDTELANAPWFVGGRLLGESGAPGTKLIKHIVDILDQYVGKVRMVAGLASPKGVGTLAQHHLEFAERKELPSGHGEIQIETQFFLEIGRAYCKFLNRKHVTGMDDVSNCHKYSRTFIFFTPRT